ncbi:MAG: hypothetical protein KDJ62_02220 [Rhodobiaceae bacterium]|nr:hypothetical protein [Rhodobiaceae bacterium]
MTERQSYIATNVQVHCDPKNNSRDAIDAGILTVDFTCSLVRQEINATNELAQDIEQSIARLKARAGEAR